MPSEIRQLDLLVEQLENRVPPASLLPLFTELDSILGSLYSIYLNELQFLADGEPQNVAANQIAQDFNAIRPLTAKLRYELGQEGSAGGLDIARELKEAVRQLFLSFGDLKRQAATGPKYSELPFTQELLRVVHHYLKGTLPMSAVLERLDAFCNYHDNLEATFENMVPNDSEESVLLERREDLEEALSLQLQGIEDLDLALEKRSDKDVKAAVEVLTVAAETLYEIYQELDQANNTVSTVTCVRCGVSSQSSARLCVGCGAQLPRFDSSQQTTTLEFHEGGRAVPAQPEELLRMHNEVNLALSSNDPQSLLDALESFGSRLTSLQNRLSAMKPPPSDIPAEHLELLNDGKSLFQESLEILSAGYELLNEGAQSLDSQRLHRGLQEVEAGYSLMQEFHQTFEQAERLTPRPAGTRAD